MIQYTLKQIAQAIDCEYRGDAECVITNIGALQSARPGEIAFLDNPRYRKYLANTQASTVIIKPEFAQECQTNAIISANPYLTYCQVAELFYVQPKVKPGIHPTAIVAESAEIAESVSIGPYCVIGERTKIAQNTVLQASCIIGDDCTIAADSWLYPRVTCYANVRIGERVILHSGVVLGSDGFGNVKTQGAWRKIPQLGGVVIGSDVEIGANTTIDCGAIGDTVIEEGVKLDNLIQIGHNVRIGAHSAMAGAAGIAGSTTVGKDCMIGGGVCINGHITITDNVVITGMSGVSKSITESGFYSGGLAAQTSREWNKNAVRFRQLEQMAKRIQALEKLVAEQNKAK
ncbi:MAG: UDP-3-O-(3-hydroxymyristoyl)glucosamine N-acyltransferase [Gammaproteobacteria bacterium]